MEEYDLLTEGQKKSFAPRNKIFLAMGCFAAAIFLWFCQMRFEDAELAARIAPEILRFHVIANSNSKEDQDLKLQVKSFLLEKIYQENHSEESPDKKKLVSYLAENQERLEQETEQFIQNKGKSYPVRINIVRCEFPEKYYGDLRLPAGLYETAQVQIGDGLGHNWWCVLYPRVCITKDALAVIPESSKKELEALLSAEDFTALKAERPRIQIDFRLLQLFRQLTADK
ncbi:MAG: stage II sporulation protein R [Lachnospiraceae bacterium]|jgi:stage II sporulation protein R|nr:stage II sporulation protein R [Lachnospiraceae bacterium]